jgi:hypothetical protein
VFSFCTVTEYARASTPLRYVALWVLWHVCAYVRIRGRGCGSGSGSSLTEFPGEVSTKTADITSSKFICNSVVSAPGSKYMTHDVKNHYLGTPIKRYEYMHILISLITQDIIDLYDLQSKVQNGYIYIKI